MYPEGEYEQSVPSEAPPSRQLQQEFAERHKHAHHRAEALFEQAREWRRIATAYAAALESFKASQDNVEKAEMF